MFVPRRERRARNPHHHFKTWLKNCVTHGPAARANSHAVMLHLNTCKSCQIVLLRAVMRLDKQTPNSVEDDMHAVMLQIFISAVIWPACEHIIADTDRYLDVIARRGKAFAEQHFPELHFHLRFCNDCRDMVNLAVRGLQLGHHPHVPNAVERGKDLAGLRLRAALRASRRASLAVATMLVAVAHELVTTPALATRDLVDAAIDGFQGSARVVSTMKAAINAIHIRDVAYMVLVAAVAEMLTMTVIASRDVVDATFNGYQSSVCTVGRMKAHIRERAVAYTLLVASITSFAAAPVTSSAYLALAGIFLFFCGGMAFEK